MFSFGRRAIDGAVLFLALYAFCVVPFGRHTGLEHLRAILGTRAAQDAGREVVDAATRLKDRLLDGDTAEPVRTRGTAALPRLPKHGAPANAGVARAADPGVVETRGTDRVEARDAPDASQ